MVGFGSEENVASFLVNVCWNCQRLWDVTLARAGLPICQVPTEGFQHVMTLANAQKCPYYDLPVYEPATCGAFLQMTPANPKYYNRVVVVGASNPNTQGNYDVQPSLLRTKPYYKRASSPDYYLFGNALVTAWILYYSTQAQPLPRHSRVYPLEGTYTPYSGATGYPTAVNDVTSGIFFFPAFPLIA
jgi:hypothetical protein